MITYGKRSSFKQKQQLNKEDEDGLHLSRPKKRRKLDAEDLELFETDCIAPVQSDLDYADALPADAPVLQRIIKTYSRQESYGKPTSSSDVPFGSHSAGRRSHVTHRPKSTYVASRTANPGTELPAETSQMFVRRRSSSKTGTTTSDITTSTHRVTTAQEIENATSGSETILHETIELEQYSTKKPISRAQRSIVSSMNKRTKSTATSALTNIKRSHEIPILSRGPEDALPTAGDTDIVHTPQASPLHPQQTITYSSPRKARPLEPSIMPEQTLSSPSRPSSSHSTPRRPAKDLSQIFDFSPPVLRQTTSLSPAKVSRRTLLRTRTEPAIASTSASENSQEARTVSLPTLPSVPTVSRTYSGKTRSFLIAMPSAQYGITPGSLEEIPAEGDEDSARESYTSLRERWGVDDSEDDPYCREFQSPSKGKSPVRQPDLPSNMMNDLKSITELRYKGESRRFLDEAGYLLEGLDPSGSISLRRSSGLEIVKKLADPEFSQKAKAADFFGKTLELLCEAGAGTDKILDIIVVIFAALVARDSLSFADLVQRPLPLDSSAPTFVSLLCAILEKTRFEKDILVLMSMKASSTQLKKAGVSRTEIVLVNDLYQFVERNSGFGVSVDQMSTPLLITHVLNSVPTMQLSASLHLRHILDSLAASLAPVKRSLQVYIDEPANSPFLGSCLPLDHIVNCLRLLDSFLLDRWNPDPEAEGDWIQQCLVQDLVDLCLMSEVLCQGNSSDELSNQTRDCTELSYRILLSLTHDEDDERWCNTILAKPGAVSMIVRGLMRSNRLIVHSRSTLLCSSAKVRKPHVKQEAEEEDSELLSPSFVGNLDKVNGDGKALDQLCLALGLLTNLAQGRGGDEMRSVLQKIGLNTNCLISSSCLLQCNCSSKQQLSGLESLVALYIDQHKMPPEEAVGVPIFVLGHIVILLGLLMMGNRSNQDSILNALPGTSRHIKIANLVDQAKEFVELYEEVIARLQIDHGAGADGTHETDSHVQRVVNDKRGCDTARDVVKFLQGLTLKWNQ